MENETESAETEPNPIDPQEFKRLIDYSFQAHQEHTTKERISHPGQFQNMIQDGRIPFAIHPLWCAMTLLYDQRVPFEERRVGYQALLLHDVLENTSMPLPDGLDQRVIDLVQKMTHETWEEEQEIEGREPLFYLLKLIDKISTTYGEGVRKDPLRRKEWLELNRQLLVKVREHYPNARIGKVAEAIIDNTDW